MAGDDHVSGLPLTVSPCDTGVQSVFGGAEPPHCGLRRRYLVSQRSLSHVELCKQDPWRAERVTEAPKLDGGCLPLSQLLKDLPSLEHVSLKTLSGLGTCSGEVLVALGTTDLQLQCSSALWLNCGSKDAHNPDEQRRVLPSPSPLVPVGQYAGLLAVPLASICPWPAAAQ